MFAFPPLTPVVKKLLIVLLGAFVAELVLQNWVDLPIFQVLALDAAHPGLATLWQLGTYILVWPPGPGSVLPFLLALVFTWWIMAPFEARFGPTRTLQLVGVTTLAASLPALVAGFLFPQGVRLAGFGPMLIGTIAAFAWSIRGRGQISLFGVIPMRPVHIIYLVVGVSLLMFLASRNVIELVADLGAVGGGIGFIWWLGRPRPKPRPKKARRRAPFQVIEGGAEDDDRPRWLN